MSIEVMTKVVQRFPEGGSLFSCMLLMANWCNDDGGSLFPSIALLAEGMRVSRTQAQRVMRKLEPASLEAFEAGDWYVRVVGNKAGGAPGMTRRYELNVARLDNLPLLSEFAKAEQRRKSKTERGRMGATGRMGAAGSMDAQEGPHGCSPTGRMGAARLVKEPSDNHQKEARERAKMPFARQRNLADYIEERFPRDHSQRRGDFTGPTIDASREEALDGKDNDPKPSTAPTGQTAFLRNWKPGQALKAMPGSERRR